MDIEQLLGFSEIRLLLEHQCQSPLGLEHVRQITFQSDPVLVRRLHQQLTEFHQLSAQAVDPLPTNFYDLRPALQRIRIEGTHLEEDEMQALKLSLATLHAWLPHFQSDEQPFPALQQLARGVFTFHAVSRRIVQLIDDYGNMRDDASQQLQLLRRQLRQSEGSVSSTLQRILRSAQADGLVDPDAAPTLRDGRLVLPVSPAMKRRLPGIVHDESASGKTVYIEPQEVVEANNHIRQLQAEEQRELLRIKQEFTATLRPHTKELLRAFSFLGQLDFLLAKSRLAQELQALSPDISDQPEADWVMARHPLLERALRQQGKKLVPLDIQLNDQQRILLISGPNAGGKSICLKTVGLLQYMLQCGLPVPMRENSRCGIFSRIMADIGDQQSLADDLSTYSAHLLNMKNMLRQADPATLLLIDEFGSGTEPTIGGAIAQALLQSFLERGAWGIVTTHYHNLKHFAEATPGIANAAMLYDRHQMRPLFQLEIGHPGSSFAVEIARQSGLPEDIIQAATRLVGQDYVNADRYLLDITRDKRYWADKRQTVHQQEKRLQSLIDDYESRSAQLQAQRREILEQARAEARAIIQDSNAAVERTIREIRQSQAEREQTKLLRQQLAEKASAPSRPSRREGKRDGTKKPLSLEKGRGEALAPGSYVRIAGQQTVGRVEKISANRATVVFGMMRTTVPLERLQPAPQPTTSNSTASATVQIVHRANEQFRQELDLRGMRADEALTAVEHYLDDALLVGAPRVRLLHGTGGGVLRQLIRQYLSTRPEVHSFHDEHVQFGGAGITVVEFT